MKRKNVLILLAALPIIAAAKDIKVSSQPVHDWVWDRTETPEIVVELTDTMGRGGETAVSIEIRGDREDSEVLHTLKGEAILVGYTPTELEVKLPKLDPGFYRVTITDEGIEAMTFNIGISPEEVISEPNAPADMDEFWQRALEELSSIPLNATMVEIPEKSGQYRKIYFCQYLSLENDTVSGYLALPVKEGKYPAIIYYNGYNGQPWDIDPDGMPEWIEFQHWVRGQGPNKPYNRYDDYIQWHLEDPEKFYYRGGFMDAIRTIDFIESLPQVDKANIFAEGGSQGGAFTFAAAALDPKHRLRAIAPYIPFLSDYEDYFEIVHWPGDVVKHKAKEIGLDDIKLYENLSYFDIKNLTPKIKIPVLMGAGLQDPTCPPHTNFAAYNNLTSEKEYVIYPLMGHTVDYSDWNPRREKFFKNAKK